MIGVMYDVCGQCQSRFSCPFETDHYIKCVYSSSKCVFFDYDFMGFAGLLSQCNAVSRVSGVKRSNSDEEYKSGVYIYFSSEKYYKIFIKRFCEGGVIR